MVHTTQVNLHTLTEVIFLVYGTLMQGCGNDHCLEGEVEFLGEVETPPAYTMISCGGFPAVFKGGQTAIKGELYRTSDRRVIERVCRLEGFNGRVGDPANHFYDATPVDTPLGVAYMFYFRDRHRLDDCRVIASGSWREHVGQRSRR